MTDPDTFYASRNIRDTTPDSIEGAVQRHIDLALPPTDAEVFDGVPTALPTEITEKVERKNENDDDWENEVTAVRRVPALRIRPIDPTGCMM